MNGNVRLFLCALVRCDFLVNSCIQCWRGVTTNAVSKGPKDKTNFVIAHLELGEMSKQQ